MGSWARSAVRQFGTSPAFSAAVVITLALGIGGVTAIVSLLDAVMLRSLPVSEPSRLYRIGDGDDTIALGRHGRWGFFSFELYERLKTTAPEFENITAFGLANPLSVRRQGNSEAARLLRAEYVSGSYFSTLGVQAFSGRLLAADDDVAGAPAAVVLSHRTWRGVFGADPSIVGASLIVEGRSFTAIGVAAPGFFGETVRADPPDLWIPLQQEPAIAGAGSLLHQSTSPWLAAIGRLRRDATLDGVAPRLTGILRQWIESGAGYPSSWMPDIRRELTRQTIDVVAAGAGIGLGGLSAKEQYGFGLAILFGICGLVTVVACANVANLLLARSVNAQAQTAVRLAIGASRRQIVVEALAESVALAMAGGLAGLTVAIPTAWLLIRLAFRQSQFVPIAMTPSALVLTFAVVLSMATGILFGVGPAWFRATTDPMDALRSVGAGTDSRFSRPRATLLIVQAALLIVVVAVSAMLTRSVANLEDQDFGYRVDGRVVIGLARLPATYTPQQLSTVYREIEERIVRLPGVRSVSLALYNPLSSVWRENVFVAGRTREDGESVVWNRVSAEYLQNLGVTLVRGRLFTATDAETSDAVAVVSESFVKRFFNANEDPIDRHFGVGESEGSGTLRIVGIIRDAKLARSGLKEPAAPLFVVPLAQAGEGSTAYRRMLTRLSHTVQGILLTTDSEPARLEPILRQALAEIDPNLTMTNIRTMRQQIALSFDRERAVATLAELFAIVALLLAAVGVYGVTSCLVARQTKEIGIRMALGADRITVIQWVLRRTIQSIAVGFVTGLIAALGAARLITAQFYGLRFWDPVALSVATLSLASIAFVAALVPACRAAAIPPMRSLHRE